MKQGATRRACDRATIEDVEWRLEMGRARGDLPLRLRLGELALEPGRHTQDLE